MNGVQSGAHVNAVFENLLPDNTDLRRLIAERTEARSDRPHDLLAAIGRDCIGAMQFLPNGAEPGDPFMIEGQPQEAVYLEEIRDGFQAQSVISTWMAFYNIKRPHSSHERRTPREVYWAGRDQRLAT